MITLITFNKNTEAKLTKLSANKLEESNKQIMLISSNTEIWRENIDDSLSSFIYVNKNGSIGVSVKGHAIVRPIEQWHNAMKYYILKTPSY